MFEEFIEKNVNSVLKSFDLSKDKIFINEIISNKDISNFYKAFALAELDWWILEEDENRKKSQNFDYSSNELQSQILEFESNLRKQAFFNIDDFKDFINFAVKSRINFLCRPQFTLTHFCFNGTYEEKAYKLIKKLSYFSEYKYFNTSFLSKLESNGITTESNISKEDFENLIEEIDYDNILNLPSKEFVELVNPIYNFFNVIDEDSGEQVAPSEALLIFFDDKSINPIVSALQKKFENAEFKFLKRDALHQFIIQMIEATESGELEEEVESVFGDSNIDMIDGEIENEEIEYKSAFDDIIEDEIDENSANENNSDELELDLDLQNAFNELNGTNEEIHLSHNEIIIDEDDVAKEFEVFDMLDAEDEFNEEKNTNDEFENQSDADSNLVDIDKFDLNNDENQNEEISNEDLNYEFDFNEIETLLETQKEEVEEIKSESIDDIDLLNKFNSVIGEIGDLDPINEDEEDLINILENDTIDTKPIDTALIGEVLIDDIEGQLNIEIEDEIKNTNVDLIEEATELLKNYNEENTKEDIEDIGKLLDDISKIND